MSHQPAATGTSADCHTDTLAAGHSYSTADATQPAAAPRAWKLEHYPSTSSADESIGELPAPRELGTLSRTLSSEPASPLSTGRSQASVPQPAAAWLSCYLIKCCHNFARGRVTPRIHVFVRVCDQFHIHSHVQFPGVFQCTRRARPRNHSRGRRRREKPESQVQLPCSAAILIR